MLNFLLKSSTYLFIWKKSKTQIISIVISLFLIWLIFGIHNDLKEIFELKDTSTLLYLMFGKWLFIILIVYFNIKLFKSVKTNQNYNDFENEQIVLPVKSQEILNKKEILTTTDLILKKYKKKEDL